MGLSLNLAKQSPALLGEPHIEPEDLKHKERFSSRYLRLPRGLQCKRHSHQPGHHDCHPARNLPTRRSTLPRRSCLWLTATTLDIVRLHTDNPHRVVFIIPLTLCRRRGHNKRYYLADELIVRARQSIWPHLIVRAHQLFRAERCLIVVWQLNSSGVWVCASIVRGTRERGDLSSTEMPRRWTAPSSTMVL